METSQQRGSREQRQGAQIQGDTQTGWQLVTRGRGVRKWSRRERQGPGHGMLCWLKLSRSQVTETQSTVAQVKGKLLDGNRSNSWNSKVRDTRESAKPSSATLHNDLHQEIVEDPCRGTLAEGRVRPRPVRTDPIVQPPSTGPPINHIVLYDHLAISNFLKFLKASSCLECRQMHAHKYLSMENQMQALNNSLPLFCLEALPKKTNGCLSKSFSVLLASMATRCYLFIGH